MKKRIFLAILAACLYALSAPLSKIMPDYMPPALTAGFLYLGASFAMCAVALFRKMRRTDRREPLLTKREITATVAMILLDIAAPILLMFGLRLTSAANASLLNNFEIVITAVVALIVFREKIGLRLWIGLALMLIGAFLCSQDEPLFKRRSKEKTD